MSNFRYIHVDSTYRDRSRFPNPAEFTFEISQTGAKNKLTALDPISTAAPQKVFSPNDFNIGGALFITGTVDTIVAGTVGATTEPLVFVAQFTAGQAQQTRDYYEGAVIVDSTSNEERRITRWVYQNTSGGVDRFLVTVDRAFTDAFAPGDTVTINNPSDITDTANPLIFIPNGEYAENFYIGCIIYNQTVNDSRPIASYDYNTRIATLDTSTAGVIAGWALTDTYVLRKTVPSETGALTGGSTTTFVLPATSSATNDFYRGDFIRMTSGAANNDVRRINSYNGTTLTGTVNPPFSGAVGAADTYEILPFTRDNFNPFNYTGSLTSQQEEVCYEIELISLTLPNKILSTGNGTRIAFYPYVFVEFNAVSGSNGGTTGIIYSNNPHAVKKLFVATVDDVPTPLIAAFIKIDGDGMVQTVKFKPNDSFNFKVTLPDGSVFTTRDLDTTSPIAPDPTLQISAVFGIRRL